MTDQPKTCANCEWSAQKSDQLFCQANPPGNMIKPGPLGNQVIEAFYPMVGPDLRCRLFEPKKPTVTP